MPAAERFAGICFKRESADEAKTHVFDANIRRSAQFSLSTAKLTLLAERWQVIFRNFL